MRATMRIKRKRRFEQAVSTLLRDAMCVPLPCVLIRSG